MNTQNNVELINECCPIFDSKKWDNKTFKWDMKPFIMAAVPAANHIPDQVKLQEAIMSMMQSAKTADQLDANMLDTLMLFMDPSPSQANVYISVTGEVPNANNVTLSGEFRSQVQKGSYESVGEKIQQLNSDLEHKNIGVKNIYAHYAYCPQCSATVGENYTVLFAEVNATSDKKN